MYRENFELQAPEKQRAGKGTEGQQLARAAERDFPGSELLDLLAPRHRGRRLHEAFAPSVTQPGPGRHAGGTGKCCTWLRKEIHGHVWAWFVLTERAC